MSLGFFGYPSLFREIMRLLKERKSMLIFSGKCVSGGNAEGEILFIGKRDSVKRRRTDNTEEEKKRVRAAVEKAEAELSALSEKTRLSIGDAEAAIFDIHVMMLKDADYSRTIDEIIEKEHVNAEYAVMLTGKRFAEMLAESGDDYMRARADDAADVSARLARILEGGEKERVRRGKHIVFAKELFPSDALRLRREDILGFVTEKGAANSHAAILARTMGVPAVVGAEGISEELDGKMCALLSDEGKIFVEPDKETLSRLRERIMRGDEEKKALNNLKGKATKTKSGRSIKLYANIGSVGDIEKVRENDAEGIGLFRSEFLYMGRSTYPDEEEQFAAYRAAAEEMGGKKVIIRTLDIGADKREDYFKLEDEENPAMGLRAVRICLKEPEIFKTQLRAILRASVFGNLAVMFPLVTSLWEIKRIKAVFQEAKEELRERGFAFDGKIETGIMIETPAAAIISDLLADEVDFFSIGTNDLTQYTIAVDRQNERLEEFYDSRHEAVLRLIKMTVENAHKKGKWVGICGELGGDDEMCEWFLDIGVDELSVSPSKVLKLRKKIRESE